MKWIILAALLFVTPAIAQSSWCSGANCSNGGVPVRNSVFTQELADQCADIKNFNCRTLVAPPKPQRRRQ